MKNFLINKIKNLQSNKGFVRYLNNTGWMFFEQILRILSGLFVGIWFARYLGPEQFGIYSYVLAFTSIFAGIAKLGLDGIIVRELINNPKKREVLLGTAFWLKLSGALIVILIVTLISSYVNNEALIKLYITIITFGLVFQSFEVVEFYFQSLVMAKIVSICKVFQLLITSLFRVYLILNDSELVYFVLVVVFDSICIGVIYFFAYKRYNGKLFFKKFDNKVAIELIKDSWPLVFSALVVMIYMRIDQLMIKQMLGDYEVGIYSAAVRLSEAFYFLPVLITASLFPAIINSKNKAKEFFYKRLLKLYTLMVWMAIFVAIIVSLTSQYLVVFLYSEKYIEASNILLVHIWASVFVFLGVASGKYLIVENMTKVAFLRTAIGAVCNVFLNLLLIPSHGALGAAVATFISQGITNLIFDMFIRKIHNQFILKIKAIFTPWQAFKN